MKDNKRGWFIRCIEGIVEFWDSGWIGIVGSVFIASSELVFCHWISAVGWLFAGMWTWAYKGEKGFYEELFNLYRKHLDICEERDKLLEVTMAELEELKKGKKVDGADSDKEG